MRTHAAGVAGHRVGESEQAPVGLPARSRAREGRGVAVSTSADAHRQRPPPHGADLVVARSRTDGAVLLVVAVRAFRSSERSRRRSLRRVLAVGPHPLTSSAVVPRPSWAASPGCALPSPRSPENADLLHWAKRRSRGAPSSLPEPGARVRARTTLEQKMDARGVTVNGGMSRVVAARSRVAGCCTSRAGRVASGGLRNNG